MNKKVVLFGKGTLAIRIAEFLSKSKDHQLVYVVPSLPEPLWTDSLTDWCKKNNIDLLTSGNPDDLPNQEFDLGVSVYFSKLFDEKEISKFKKLINIHNSPLPKYRGANPINWALKNGEKMHGVTVHEIDLGIDSGKILNQVFFPINPDEDEVEDVYRRCLGYAYELFVDTITRIDSIKGYLLNDAESSIYYRRDFEKLGERRFFNRKLNDTYQPAQTSL